MTRGNLAKIGGRETLVLLLSLWLALIPGIGHARQAAEAPVTPYRVTADYLPNLVAPAAEPRPAIRLPAADPDGDGPGTGHSSVIAPIPAARLPVGLGAGSIFPFAPPALSATGPLDRFRARAPPAF